MPFVKGKQKTGGRKKGVQNRLNLDVRLRLEELGCDPIEGMATLAMDSKTPLELRGRMYSELAKYVWPQRKAVEISGPDGGPIELNDASAKESLEARIAGIAAQLGATGGLSPTQ